MDNLELDRAELEELTLLLNEVECVFDDLKSSVTLLQSGVYAHKIPSRLRFAFNEFRLGQMSGVLRISGYPVDQERLGPTPSHWRGRPVPSTTRREELLLILFSSLLGDPFCWATQQDGMLIHDVFPIEGHENGPLGSSSESPAHLAHRGSLPPATRGFYILRMSQKSIRNRHDNRICRFA